MTNDYLKEYNQDEMTNDYQLVRFSELDIHNRNRDAVRHLKIYNRNEFVQFRIDLFKKLIV